MNDMLKHLPEFISDMQVFKQESKALTPELELIEDKIKTLQDNQFINFANDSGLSRYEKMFNLAKESTIQKRRASILSKMQQGSSYTWFWLINYLNSLLGETNYTISIEDLVLQINIAIKVKSYFLFLKKDLRTKIPVNIFLEISLIYTIWETLKPYFWEEFSNITWDNLWEDDLSEKLPLYTIWETLNSHFWGELFNIAWNDLKESDLNESNK